MEQKSRQPVGKDYVQEFDLNKPTASSLVSGSLSQPQEASEISRRLEAVWFSEGGERGGDDLDDFLSDFGNSYVEEGRVKWDPPSDLDPIFIEYFSRSVEELNTRIGLGIIKIDENGNIRPA